ncbi:hypothetical protein [Nocardioides jiangxiensis]|uniref:Alternate signal-mediated exported protein, RER_14450 family n=1 Tax=Nocardioides jiangxiensis TaxID=3064524 RepID=A0ABT9AYT5_9ACTN|nr:hypothetical protein [Nocardioides sp. WY-20]MDO7867739.1 hypothetical protein [Nocardioides sp. WY-20]
MSNAVSPASRTRRNLLIVLSAIAVLAVLVGALLLLNKGDDETDEAAGSLHELRRDQFATALINAREKAGSWTYLEAQTLNGKPNGVVNGKVTWDGTHVNLAFAPQGSTDGAGEFRYVDGDWYYYNPKDDAKKPWLKLDRAKSKVLVDALDNEADPRRQLAIFEDPAGFQVVGVENVGVAEAVHYRVTVSIEKVKEVTSNPVVGNPGDHQVYDVWVNDKDQIVKLTIPTDIGAVTSEEIRTFSGYGDKVEIDVPPAGETRVAAVVARPKATKTAAPGADR